MKWKIASQICAAIGVTMTAMQAVLIEILNHPLDNLYLAMQAGVIALGLYCVSQIKEETVTP